MWNLSLMARTVEAPRLKHGSCDPCETRVPMISCTLSLGKSFTITIYVNTTGIRVRHDTSKRATIGPLVHPGKLIRSPYLEPPEQMRTVLAKVRTAL